MLFCIVNIKKMVYCKTYNDRVPLADEGVERLAALDKENAELKRRLANSAVAIEQAKKPVEVEKLVTDPALVAEVEQVWNVTNKRAACIGVVI
jgi:predicted metal-binding transcription factor (methanogenesis marker protein 9)